MSLDSIYVHGDIDEEVKDRKIVVAWSGGWDSVALLAYMAHKYGTSENPVIAIHHSSDNIPRKQRRNEHLARYRARKKFKELGLHIEYGKSYTNFDYAFGYKYGGIAQAPINLISPLFTSKDDVAMCYGYVKGDDFWHYKHDFVKAYEHLCGLLENRNPKVIFPFEWTSKQTIYNYLIDNDLIDCTTFCEDPINTLPCGTCGSCKRVKMEVPAFKFPEKQHVEKYSWRRTRKEEYADEMSIFEKQAEKAKAKVLKLSDELMKAVDSYKPIEEKIDKLNTKYADVAVDRPAEVDYDIIEDETKG